MKNFISFSRKSKVSCYNVSIYKVLFEYICWVLAGKPADFEQVYEPDIDLEVSAEHKMKKERSK
tara:strand:+ start:732 stop:923 length:192 start_codon:yes stop_codon:yes gene_type:complete